MTSARLKKHSTATARPTTGERCRRSAEFGASHQKLVRRHNNKSNTNTKKNKTNNDDINSNSTSTITIITSEPRHVIIGKNCMACQRASHVIHKNGMFLGITSRNLGKDKTARNTNMNNKTTTKQRQQFLQQRTAL